MKKLLFILAILIIGCTTSNDKTNDKTLEVRIEIEGSGNYSASISGYQTLPFETDITSINAFFLNEERISIPYNKTFTINKLFNEGTVKVMLITYTFNDIKKMNLYINGEQVYSTKGHRYQPNVGQPPSFYTLRCYYKYE